MVQSARSRSHGLQIAHGCVHIRRQQLADFLTAVENGTEPLITLEDGRRTVELITGIYRSMRDGKPVKFPLQPEYGDDYDGRIRK